MKFWVDAQLPPNLAKWLSVEFDVEAVSLRDLGLRDSTDGEIFKVTSGSVTNRQLQKILGKTFPAAMALLAAGEKIVEIG